MELYSKQDPELRKRLANHIDKRWWQLYELEKEWGERALRYLLFTNSGGAIATLGFLGGAPGAISMTGIKVSLFSFILGVVLVGISTAKTFHHMSKLFKHWQNDLDHYYEDKITWSHLHHQDQQRAVEDFFDYAIPYASFICFLIGVVSGGHSLFS